MNPSLQLITEAVVAQYIHEISERHQAPERESAQPEQTRPAGPSGVDGIDRLAA